MTAFASMPTSMVRESLLFAGRLLLRWRRHPTVPIQSLLFPTFLLISYHLLVSKSVARITGTGNLYGLVPMCAVAGGMFGALGVGLTIPNERATGLLSRMWTFPVHRASALAGRLVAEAARTLVGTVLITAVGIGLGLRFHGNFFALLVFLLIPVLVVVVFATFVIAVSLRAENFTVFGWVGSAAIGMVFCNAAVAPLQRFPAWVRPLIEIQPMSPVIKSMQALAQGGASLWPLLMALGWLLVLAAAFVPLALRNYRIAAEHTG